MKKYQLLSFLFVLIVLFSNQTYAITEKKDRSIRKLFELMDITSQTEETMIYMAQQEIKKEIPSIPINTEHAISQAVSKLIKEECEEFLIPNYVVVYDKYFTDVDIEELIKFYDSPIGRKFNIGFLNIMKDTYEVGLEWQKRLSPKLMKLIDDQFKPLKVESNNEIAPVYAAVATQDSEGCTEADFDQAGLKNLENWMVQTTIEKGKNYYAELGNDPKDFKPWVEAKSLYITVEGKKLAVIKINLDNIIRSVAIFGIQGKELVRVHCIRCSNHDIPVTYGVCGDKVKEIFNISFPQEEE